MSPTNRDWNNALYNFKKNTSNKMSFYNNESCIMLHGIFLCSECNQGINS